MTQSFTTKDGQLIAPGVEIYYTGDMANCEGFGVIKNVEICNWYRFSIHILLEDDRFFTLSPSAFEPGVGTRFFTKKKYLANRKAKLDALFERTSKILAREVFNGSK